MTNLLDTIKETPKKPRLYTVIVHNTLTKKDYEIQVSAYFPNTASYLATAHYAHVLNTDHYALLVKSIK